MKSSNQLKQVVSRKKDGFRQGSGCFKCEACGKLTRQTDRTSGTKLCKECCENTEMENAIVDGAITSEVDVRPEDLHIYRRVISPPTSKEVGIRNEESL